jgi:hypothetical protein
MDGETIALRERAFLKRLFGEEWHFQEGDWLFRRGSSKNWGLVKVAVAGAVKRRLDPRQLARRVRLAKEMRLTLEIIPGRAIGPFQLGMTFQEIEATLRSLHSERVTLDDLGIVASCSERRKGTLRPSDRCDEMEIKCVGTIAKLLLLGQPVDQIALEDLYHLLRVQHRYDVRCDFFWGHLDSDAGISATKWERDDQYIYSIFVTAPKPVPRPQKEFDFSEDRGVSKLSKGLQETHIQSTVKLPANRQWSGTARFVDFTISGDKISSISWEGEPDGLEETYLEAKRILVELRFSVHELEGWYRRLRGEKKVRPFSIRDKAGNPKIHVAVRSNQKKEWIKALWAVQVEVSWKKAKR